MNRILLDTSVYSAFMRGDDATKGAVQEADEIYLNSTIIGELLSGFIRGKHEFKNRRELQEVLDSPRVGLLSVDEETAERYAVILNDLRKKGTPIPTNDIWIAASAMQYGLVIATFDEHYKKIDQVLAVTPQIH